VTSLAELAADTDILVHEAIDVDYFARLWNNNGALQHMQEAHSSSQDVGRVATAASAKSLVLSHIGPGGDSRLVSDDQWLPRVTQTYASPATIGHDLTQIEVGQRQQGQPLALIPGRRLLARCCCYQVCRAGGRKWNRCSQA